MSAAVETGTFVGFVGSHGTAMYAGLLATPATVTITAPVPAPAGTMALISVSDHVVTAALIPRNVTVLDPWLLPNPAPVIRTTSLKKASDGFTLVIIGPEGLTETSRLK